MNSSVLAPLRKFRSTETFLLGLSSVYKPKNRRTGYFFQRGTNVSRMVTVREKNTGPIVHGSVHGNRDRKQRMKGNRKKSVARKVTKGTYKFQFLFFQSEKWRESKVTEYVKLSTTTTAADLPLCASKYSCCSILQ